MASSSTKPETCRGCPLYESGQGFVMGDGPVTAAIVKVGEAPGAEEAINNRVFSGPSGKLMNQLDYAAGLYRSEMYVMNVLCCRPPGNRPPMKKEIEHCSQYFDRQMEMLTQRTVIVALGGTALERLTGLTHITKWRGSTLDSKYGKVLPSVHPAAIFRQQNMLPLYLSDMQKVKREAAFKEVHRTPTTYITSPTEADISNMGLSSAPKVGLDLETCGDKLDLFSGFIRVCGLSERPGKGVCIPWSQAAPHVRELLARPDVTLGIHNSQFDLSWLELRGIECRAKVFDTMLALHLVSSDLPNDLGFGASVYTDMPFWKDEESSNPALYNCKDVDAHRRLMDVLDSELELTGQKKVFNQIVMPLVPVCMAMTIKGIKRDEIQTVKFHRALEKQLLRYEMTLSSALGKKYFDWRSPKQVMNLVYKEMGIEPILHKKTGRPTVDREALERLNERAKSKIVSLILEMRNIDKLLGTYFSHLTPDGRLHPDFLIHGTVTGRTSSRNPNIQNIPRGPARQSIIPSEPNWLFISADYKQIEFRLTAYQAGEEELIDCFEGRHSGQPCQGDAFRHVAGDFYSRPLDKVEPTQRQLAKGIVYGLNYGQGSSSMANQYAISPAQAKVFIAKYFAKYRKIKAWRDRILADLERDGYITSLLGRRRYLYGYDKATKAFIFPAQSPAADVKNTAMIRLHAELPKPARLCFEVHDEVIIEAPPELMDMTIECVKDVMLRPIPELGGKRMQIDINFGRNYDEASAKEGLAANWRQLGRQVK